MRNEYLYLFRSFLLLSGLMWMLCLVVCFIFSLLPPSLCENETLCWWSLWGNTESVFKFEVAVVNVWLVPIWKFVFEVVTNAFSMFCESKGSLKIKQNLTRYNTLLTVTYFWLHINWNANTLIHMYRDLGHGQPRFSSESRLESVMEKLKTLLGGPAQTKTNNGIAARLP